VFKRICYVAGLVCISGHDIIMGSIGDFRSGHLAKFMCTYVLVAIITAMYQVIVWGRDALMPRSG